MANFYVSSAAYAAITPWAATTAYTVGQIIRPTAAVAGKKIAYRCTTGGTTAGSEPTWGLVLGGTTTSNTAVFTAINSDTYGWTGAAGDFNTVTNISTTSFATAGDAIFLSSDHTETAASGLTLMNSVGGGWVTTTTLILSVNRAGSVPPVAGDLTSGATIAATSIIFNSGGPVWIEGVTLQASAGSLQFNSSGGGYQSTYFKNCSLQLTGASSTYKIGCANPTRVIFDNTTLSFGNAGQGISTAAVLDLFWVNTTSAIAGTTPTILFQVGAGGISAVLRGVDVSAVGTLVGVGSSAGAWLVLDSCKVGSSVVAFSGTANSNLDQIDMVNCWDGTNVRNEHYQTSGAVTTSRATYLSASGAADDVSSYSLKMVTPATKVDRWVEPLASFWFDAENTSTGSSKTATVEIVSSSSLNTDDVWLQLEYMGTAGSQVVSISSSQSATPLTASAAVTTSAASWTSPPATPVYQKLQVTFTPQVAGRVRGRVMLGKPSITAYVNPVIAIT